MLKKIEINRLFRAATRSLHPTNAKSIAKDIFGIRNHIGDSETHLYGTLEWIKNAHEQAGNKGVAGGYSLIDGWLPPYPETTGYIIPTLLDFAEVSSEDDWRERALRMADWEIDVQMENGAVQAGLYEPGKPQVEAVFNTGQVVRGWCRIYSDTEFERFREAAIRAGNWLLKFQDDDGAWRISSAETETKVHAYDVRTAWSLLELYKITGAEEYKRAAISNIEWTLERQTNNGWFENNSFFRTEENWSNPFTHMIAYVMEGLIESYKFLGTQKILDATVKTAERLLRIFEIKKYMHGDFDKNWKPTTNYSCLTGDAQIAGVWLQIFEITNDVRFLNGALKLSDFVKSTQNLKAVNKGIRGGVKGSQPLNGKYTPFVFPNWAAKFHADTLMREIRVMKEVEQNVLSGAKIGS
ncbi:MAG: hypothetical protein ACK5NT_03345 [Pyrinomonadaceae bacterium]